MKMSTTMISTAKQQIQRILQNLPDNCSIEDVQYHLYVVEKIGRRLQAADPSDFLAQTEAERRLARWQVA
jgi:hypothetical protein